jgi:hypothetical protein
MSAGTTLVQVFRGISLGLGVVCDNGLPRTSQFVSLYQAMETMLASDTNWQEEFVHAHPEEVHNPSFD